MTMHPNAAAAMLAYGMTSVIMQAGRAAADARQSRVQDVWAEALAAARGNAHRMSLVAVEAIRRAGDLEEEVARLRRLLKQRTDALQFVRQEDNQL